MNKKKAMQTARDWLEPALMFAIFDCSDSMEDAESLENRFNAHVDDTIKIADFVKANLYKEYIAACLEVSKSEGEDNSVVELKDTPTQLPIPWNLIEEDIKRAISKKTLTDFKEAVDKRDMVVLKLAKKITSGEVFAEGNGYKIQTSVFDFKDGIQLSLVVGHQSFAVGPLLKEQEGTMMREYVEWWAKQIKICLDVINKESK